MDRIATSLALIGFLTCIGCGRSSQSETADAQPSQPPVAPAASVAATPTPIQTGSPADIVSQFLDEIRRGGEDTRANDLLTTQAQAELRRIGQSVQPIGSPDARFQVTRHEEVPGEPTSALVHSIWSEPNGDGTSSNFQVVWAVEQEQVGWRISGLAMELAPNQPPMIIDFENGELMAKLLAAPGEEPSNGSGAQSQAGAPGNTISR